MEPLHVAILWLACVVFSWSIGERKGHGCLCSILGLFLGPIGALIALAIPSRFTKCRECRKSIERKATICPYCRTRQVN